MMGPFSVTLGMLALLIAGSLLPQGGIVIEEKEFYPQSNESFANQLMWMGQDDGQ